MPKKVLECKSCISLSERLDRLERRLGRSEEDARHWKKRWSRVDDELRAANGRISLLETENGQLKRTISKKDAQLQQLKKDKFGQKTEVSEVLQGQENPEWEAAPPKRPRGKQPGTKGFGRKLRTNLPSQDRFHDVSPEQKLCESCGKERMELPFTEDSEEIYYEQRLVRIKHKRRKYKRSCTCKHGRSIITADAPAKLIPKGMLSTELWAHILIEKFWLQRPISRICASLSLQGLQLSEGTVASGLKTITKLFAPLYNALRLRSKGAGKWQMDETHWRIFTDLMGKDNHKWWLWVVESSDVTVFLLDPTRSSAVPKRHLKDVTAGILTCDRYAAYQPLQEQGIELSYCWSHVRRDFIKLRDGFPELHHFGEEWVTRIDWMFHQHKRGQHADVLATTKRLERDAKRLLKKGNLHEEVRATLQSLQKHWKGLTLFLEYDSVPMDNNACERAIRNSVCGRKAYYGNHAIWAGCLASMLFSIFSTLAKNRIDPYSYMVEYLSACASNGGRVPANIDHFLPWNYRKSTPQETTTCRVH